MLCQGLRWVGMQPGCELLPIKKAFVTNCLFFILLSSITKTYDSMTTCKKTPFFLNLCTSCQLNCNASPSESVVRLLYARPSFIASSQWVSTATMWWNENYNKASTVRDSSHIFKKLRYLALKAVYGHPCFGFVNQASQPLNVAFSHQISIPIKSKGWCSSLKSCVICSDMFT